MNTLILAAYGLAWGLICAYMANNAMNFRKAAKLFKPFYLKAVVYIVFYMLPLFIGVFSGLAILAWISGDAESVRNAFEMSYKNGFLGLFIGFYFAVAAVLAYFRNFGFRRDNNVTKQQY